MLQDSAARERVYAAFINSPYREAKVDFKQFLREASSGRFSEDLAARQGRSAAQLLQELDGLPKLEMYLPVPAHRTEWKGGANLLIGTIGSEDSDPVVFALGGARVSGITHLAPPSTPVILLRRAEHFLPRSSDASMMACPPELNCEGGGGGGGGGGTGGGGSSVQGLWLENIKVTDLHEGWGSGAPELEVIIERLNASQQSTGEWYCAGEHWDSYSGRYFDLNDANVLWTGDAFLAPGSTYPYWEFARVLVNEDDDGNDCNGGGFPSWGNPNIAGNDDDQVGVTSPFRPTAGPSTGNFGDVRELLVIFGIR